MDRTFWILSSVDPNAYFKVLVPIPAYMLVSLIANRANETYF